MDYSISELASITGAELTRDNGERVSTLLTDSRSLLEPEGTLFFALRTASGDGHKYLRELYERGVRAFVVDTLPEDADDMPEASFLKVESPLAALQAIAARHRGRMSCPVVALTGSRGKTTVKEWLYRILSPAHHVVRSPRSFNSQTGVPLSLWQLDELTQLAVIEAGISLPGEMERLERMIKPDVVIFTNIGAAHSLGFESIEEKCREKATLMRGCRYAVYCADNSLIASSIPVGPERVGWSRHDAPEAWLNVTTTKGDGRTVIAYRTSDGATAGEVTIPFTSERDVENALHVLTTVLRMGMLTEDARRRMAQLLPVSTRLEVVDGVNDCQLIHDTYSADLHSLSLALDFVERRLTPEHSLTLILGDLDTEGHDAAEVYARAALLLKLRRVKRVIGIGRQIDAHASSLPEESVTYQSVAKFIEAVRPEDFRSELILIKGSPDEPFAEVARMLELKRHETVLEINLDAVVDNFNFFRSHIDPATGIVCMIKASGYGAGSHELAKTLQSQGATYLAVAVHDEGVDLRQAGITMPIIVLNPAVDSLKTIFEYRLEPEIYSIEFLRSLIDEAARRGVRNYPVHIKIDSGMHRLGFLLETLPEVIKLLRGQDYVVPQSIFSHLCAADDPSEDDYTRSQFDYFDRCCAMLQEAFPERKILRHILNSTGITRFPEHQCDMVRLGIGLYGIRTMHDGSQDELRPVSTLRSSIISIKHWPEGTTIGYNRRGRLKRDSLIATVPIGYADGLNRHLGWGNSAFNVRGVMCPIVGTICMDACMIDVTDVPGVGIGDSVEIFGDTIPVDSLAAILDTIPYEVLTSISQRVKRVYFRE